MKYEKKQFSTMSNNMKEKNCGWISVKERLPEMDGWYLTCRNCAGHPSDVQETYFYAESKSWNPFDVDVDYWMCVPELPISLA